MIEEHSVEQSKPGTGFRVPHTLVLLMSMIFAAWILTLLLPAGSFDRITNDAGREQVVPGSYHHLTSEEFEQPGVLDSFWGMFKAIPAGFEAAAGIIFFVLIIGGAFGVFRATGAADALIGSLLRNLGDKPFFLIAGAMGIFAAGSATIGMAEEYLPFVPMLVALCIALGYDSMTAVGVLCVGYGVGYGAALINPFTVFIAQDVADVPQGSGLLFRLILLVVFLAIGIHHVWRYAKRVKRDPSSSLVADVAKQAGAGETAYPAFTTRHGLVLAFVVIAIVILLIGLKFWHWYLVEMGALFIALAVALAIVSSLGADRAAGEFCTGAAELTTTAILIGFARTIEVVLSEGRVIDTVIYAIAQPLEALGAHLAAVGMLFVQSAANLFVPSGSGQAYVTMPLMAPLADLVGITRQTAVLAYQFGDGFTNIVVPTNAVLVGILAMAGIPYDRWVRFVAPFIGKVLVVASIALIIAVSISWQ